jgi:hypothetical protein
MIGKVSSTLRSRTAPDRLNSLLPDETLCLTQFEAMEEPLEEKGGAPLVRTPTPTMGLASTLPHSQPHPAPSLVFSEEEQRLRDEGAPPDLQPPPVVASLPLEQPSAAALSKPPA